MAGHRVVAFSATTGMPVPPTYIGYDMDVAGRSWSTLLADYYVHAFNIDGFYTPSAVGIWGGDAIGVQSLLDTALVAAGYTSGTLIWSADPLAGTITLWADPTFLMAAQNPFIFAGDAVGTQERYTPSVIVTTPPPTTSGSCVLIQVDATGTVTTAPMIIGGVTYNAQTPVQTILEALVSAPELWESVVVAGAVGGGTQTRLVASPTKLVVDDALGNVGINVAPTQYDLSVGGETTLYPSATAAPNLRERSALGSIVSYGELIDATTTATTLPYLAIDLGPVSAVDLAWTIDYRVRRGVTTSKQVGGQIYMLATPTPAITRLEASSYSADLIDEVVGGIDPATNRVMLFVNAKSTLSWEFSVFARTEGMETAGVPYRWTATAMAALPAYATVIGDIKNTFWQNLTKGRLEFSRITNGVAQNERRVWDINGIVSAANSWAEINTHFIPTVDGGAALGVEIRQRAGTAVGTASGQLSFSVTSAGVISNVAWESHGGRLPTNIGVGLNAAGEVVILYRDTGPTGGYAIHTEVYGHTITQKKLWDLATLAADPSVGYTSFTNATVAASPVSGVQLWTDNGANLFPTLTAQNNSVVISDTTGNVGINSAPLASYDLAMKGISIIENDPLGQVANQRLRTAGYTKSNQEFFDYSGVNPNARYIIIDTKLTAAVLFANVTIDFTVHMGGQLVRKIKGTLWCTINSGVPIQVQGSLTGFDAPIAIWAGVNSLTSTACIVIDNTTPWETSILELSVTANNPALEIAGVPVRFAASSVAALPAWATLSATIRNAFLAVTGTTASFTGAVTAPAFLIASDPSIKKGITALDPAIAEKIITTVPIATWEYDDTGVMENGTPSAGFADAGKIRDLLPTEMAEAFTPLIDYKLTGKTEAEPIVFISQQFVTAVMLTHVKTLTDQVAAQQAAITKLSASLATANKTLAAQATAITDLTARVTKLDGGAAAKV
jgi:uncharacterized coiled-coil protein SlyX